MKICSNCDRENEDHRVTCKWCNIPFPKSTIKPLSIPTHSSGKSTSVIVPPPSITSKGSIKTPIITGPITPPSSPYPHFPTRYVYTLPSNLRKQGKPNLQGKIVDVSEHRVTDRNSLPLILGGLIMMKDFFSGLSMMYWGRNREISVTNFLLEEERTGNRREALLIKPQGSHPRMGDHVSLFGREVSGCLQVRFGYNHDTTAQFYGK